MRWLPSDPMARATVVIFSAVVAAVPLAYAIVYFWICAP